MISFTQAILKDGSIDLQLNADGYYVRIITQEAKFGAVLCREGKDRYMPINTHFKGRITVGEFIPLVMDHINEQDLIARYEEKFLQ